MPGGYTGDDSVKWFVDSKNPKPGTGTPAHQEGTDDSAHAGRFYITIAYPIDTTQRSAFRQQLYDAWTQSAAAAVTEVTLDIPIEDTHSKYGKTHKGEGTDYQIYVEWD